MDEDRQQRDKASNQAVCFLLHGQKKIALQCSLNLRSVQHYASMRVFLPAPALSMALVQGKILWVSN